MSDLSVLSVAEKIEESTDRIVEALDRLTIATMAGKSKSSLEWAAEVLDKVKGNCSEER